MKPLHLVRIGEVAEDLLGEMQAALGKQFGIPCEVVRARLDPEFAFDCNRQQYHSTEILARMAGLDPAQPMWRLLGVTPVDLFIPILTFVFGEAQLNGTGAVISLHRLRQEFYGLPQDRPLLVQRALKEAVHELGHTLGLKHCSDYGCVMAPSHSVEWIDLKAEHFCTSCRKAARLA